MGLGGLQIIDPISQSITNHAHYVRLREKVKRASERASKRLIQPASSHNQERSHGTITDQATTTTQAKHLRFEGRHNKHPGSRFTSGMAQLARHNQHIHMRGHHQGSTHLSESPPAQHTSTSMPEDYSSARAFKHRHDQHIHMCSHHLYSMQAAYSAARHQRASTQLTSLSG
jgi:hypothetical protein